MSKMPSKIAMLGFDCAQPHLIEEIIHEGHAPNFKKFLDNGAWADDCLCPFPSITPPNWAAMATGANPGTNGVCDFYAHTPGTAIRWSEAGQNWSSSVIVAETIWEAADKAGKRCVVFNYPGAWPSKMQNGVVVCSRGFTVGESGRHGLPGLLNECDFRADFIISNGYGPETVHVKQEEAEGWVNCPDMGEEPMEFEVHLPLEKAPSKPEATTWWVLLRKLNGAPEYNSISLCTSKDFNSALCTLAPKEWSKKITVPIAMQNGGINRAAFRCKFLETSADGDEFRLLVGAMVNIDTQWTDPIEYNERLFQGEACMHINGGFMLYAFGLLDDETYVECNEEHARWMAETAHAFLADGNWDLFYMHSHPMDWCYHAVLTNMQSEDPHVRKRGYDIHRQVIMAEDKLLGELLDMIGNDALVAVASDHGATADGAPFNPSIPMEAAGLVAPMAEKTRLGDDSEIAGDYHQKAGGGANRQEKLDLSHTKAALKGSMHIFINLKGRDPGGIVEPEDYEKVQQEIIDALLTYRDPKTNDRPVVMALTKQDARLIGQYGDRCGDVIYAIKPTYGSQHGPILPTAKWGVGSLNSLMAFMGHGIKKGFRLSRPCHLISLAPTLAYATGFPMPADAEGAVLYQMLQDPNSVSKEVAKLKKSLDSMEVAMSRHMREPWDKHDCA